MRLELSNVAARVVEASEAEEAWIDDYLTIKTKNSRYTGYPIRLYNRFGKHFPAGNLRKLASAAQEAGHQVRTVDMRKTPCKPDDSIDVSWLRWYQTEAVEACLAKTRGILHHATGAGKTNTAIALMLKIPCKWVFLVHRTTLAHQAAARFALYSDEPVGIIGDGLWSEERVTFATLQTLYASLKSKDKAAAQSAIRFLESREGLVGDEVHTFASKTFYYTTMRTPNAYYRIGLSGTPLDRGDDKNIYIVAAFGPTIHKVPAEVLIDEGILARPKIVVTPVYVPVPSKTLDGVRKTFGTIYREGIVSSDARNRAIVQDILAAEKPCLVFIKDLPHGRELERLVGRHQLAVDFISGKDNTHARKTAIKDLAYSNLDVLIATVILQEGADIPEVASIVNAAGLKGIIALLQKLGRGMRTKDLQGNLIKTQFNVYDYLDKGNRHLEEHSRKRLAAYTAQGYEIVAKTPT